MRRCSGLVNHKARTANFITPCCSQAAQICQNDNTNRPSTIVTSISIYDARVPTTTVSVNISQPTSNISNTIGITSNLSSITAHVDCSATPTNIDSTSLFQDHATELQWIKRQITRDSTFHSNEQCISHRTPGN